MKRIALVMAALILTGGLAFFADRIGPLREGEAAPRFTARLSNGETVSLSDFAGRKNVVLIFYPEDFTSGCTREVCSYRDSYGEISRLDGVMFGVSYDDDSTHGEFIDRYRLPFPLISDRDMIISKAYGAARLGGLIKLQRRITYVIDKKGIIRKVSHHEFLINRLVEDVLAELRELQG